MTDRDKVIKGLEWCMNEKHDCYREKGCPYENDGEDIGCKYALHRDALALLKAQEPRLVTPEDFENADEYGFIPVWCEVTGNTSDPFVIKDYWNCIPIDALETAREDGYRYWTAKPSLKKMEETLWN